MRFLGIKCGMSKKLSFWFSFIVDFSCHDARLVLAGQAIRHKKVFKTEKWCIVSYVQNSVIEFPFGVAIF